MRYGNALLMRLGYIRAQRRGHVCGTVSWHRPHFADLGTAAIGGRLSR